MITSSLIFTAFIFAVGGQQVHSTEEDWAWLDRYRWEVIDKLMPVAGSAGAVVTFRSHRDLYHDVRENYFQISRDARTDTFTAVVVRPDGSSLQQQLLDLHLGNRMLNVEELGQKLRFQQFELTEAQCPSLRSQMDALSQVKFRPPTRDVIILHPMVYRMVINFGGGSVDAALLEEENALVQWALRTADALRACIQRRRG